MKFVIPKRRCASEKQHGLESTMASAVAYVDPFYLSINVILNSSYLCDRHFKLILFIYLFIYLFIVFCLLLYSFSLNRKLKKVTFLFPPSFINPIRPRSD